MHISPAVSSAPDPTANGEFWFSPPRPLLVLRRRKLPLTNCRAFGNGVTVLVLRGRRAYGDAGNLRYSRDEPDLPVSSKAVERLPAACRRWPTVDPRGTEAQ